MKVAFIGLGRMGTAMADRLLGGGHDLAVYNRSSGKDDDLVDRGAKRSTRSRRRRATGRRSSPCSGTTRRSRPWRRVRAALSPSMQKGAIHVAMGTHSLNLIRTLTAAHAEAGQVLVGAPVMGRPPVAAAGQLGILAGGPPQRSKRARRSLPRWATDLRRRHRTDGGRRGKIANNLVLACAIEAMSEGFALAEKCGVLRPRLSRHPDGRPVRGPGLPDYGKIIADKAYFGEAGFTATTGLKDINLALAAGEASGVPMLALNASRDRLLAAIAQGHGDRDWTVMALEQMRASGIGCAFPPSRRRPAKRRQRWLCTAGLRTASHQVQKLVGVVDCGVRSAASSRPAILAAIVSAMPWAKASDAPCAMKRARYASSGSCSNRTGLPSDRPT